VRHRLPVTVYLPPASLAALGRRAESESRSKSKTAELILRRELDQDGQPAEGKRTGKCPHGVKPGAHCKRGCDD
jgi:hypothetical protein